MRYRARHHRRRIGRRGRGRGAAPAGSRPRSRRHWLARRPAGCRGGGHGPPVGDQRGTAGSPPRRALPAGQRRGEPVAAGHCRGAAGPGNGGHGWRRHGRSHDLAVWVASLMVSFGLSRTIARPCDARFPLPVRLDLVVPAATRSGVGSRRHGRWPAARLSAADSRLRALPARPSRICDHCVDDQRGFLRGVCLSLLRTAGELRGPSRTPPNTGAAALCA